MIQKLDDIIMAGVIAFIVVGSVIYTGKALQKANDGRIHKVVVQLINGEV